MLNVFLICYGFTLAPNLYSVFACAFMLLFLGTNNVFVPIIIELAAACIPVTYHFLTDDYILLNMLTYFPYPDESHYYQILAYVVMVWLIFMITYGVQFVVSRKMNYQKNLNQVWHQVFRNEMR